METLGTLARGFGCLFYLVNPYETMFQSHKDVPKPDYVAKVRSKISQNQIINFKKKQFLSLGRSVFLHSNFAGAFCSSIPGEIPGNPNQ
jgi:hypothetical protein